MTQKPVPTPLTRRQFLLGASTALASLFIPPQISRRVHQAPARQGFEVSRRL